MKYIQETEWWKEARKAAVKALNEEHHNVINKAIIEALGQGGALKRGLPPKGAGRA